MPEKKYWIVNENGQKAVAGSAAERDKFAELGYAESDEPGLADFVWMQHKKTGGKQAFPQPAVALWEPNGWEVSSPPDAVDLTKDPALHDQPVKLSRTEPGETKASTK